MLVSLRGRVANMHVVQRGATGCPAVILRGRHMTAGLSEAVIYLDGTRAVDGCILGQLSTNDVERVEVYPHGVTHRPGYPASAAGLILIFTRSGA